MQKKLSTKNFQSISFSNSDDEDEDTPAGNSVAMFNSPVIIQSVDAYIDGPIIGLPYYRNLLHYINTMEEGDELRIWLNTPGGYLNTALALVDAMDNTAGSVTCIVQGDALSAGSLIALAAPNMIVGDSATFMMHTASYSPGVAKAGNVNSSVQYSTRQIEKIARKYYSLFLTESEITEMLEGKDFWFDADEARRRLDIRADVQAKMKGDTAANSSESD